MFFSFVDRKAAMATLVKRSDAPLYRVFIGDDWKLFAWSLSHEQCFEVNVVLHNPFATPDAQDKVAAAICCIGDFGFVCSVAVRVLLVPLDPFPFGNVYALLVPDVMCNLGLTASFVV